MFRYPADFGDPTHEEVQDRPAGIRRHAEGRAVVAAMAGRLAISLTGLLRRLLRGWCQVDCSLSAAQSGWRGTFKLYRGPEEFNGFETH